MANKTTVLLITDDPERRDQWQTALDAAHHFAVILESEMVAAPCVPDVVVVDQLPLADRLGIWSAPLQRGEIGVIGIGCTGVADVVLPAKHSPRELRLACRLLAQVAHLRSRLQREQTCSRLLEKLVHRDDLTELANRRAWVRHLQRQATAIHAGAMPVCLALLDLDHFKRINSTLGHAVGDQTLKAIGRRLRDICRPPNFAARLGGDEFAVLLYVANRDQAFPAVEQLRIQMTQVDLPASIAWTVTASAGLVTLPIDAAGDVSAFMAVADDALRVAKRDGRDRTHQNYL